MPLNHQDISNVWIGDVSWDAENGILEYKVSWTGYDGVYHLITEKTKDYDDETRERILQTINDFDS